MKFFVFLSLVAAATFVASHPLGGKATNSSLDSAMYEEDGEAASEIMRMKRNLHSYKTKSDSSSISLQTPLTNIAIQKSRVRTRPLDLHQPLHHLIHGSAGYLHSMLFDNEDAAAATNAETAEAGNARTAASANANAMANAGSQILINGVPLYPGQVSFLGSYCPIFGTPGFETLANSANIGGISGSYTKTSATATAEGSSYGKNIVAEGYSQSGSRVDGTGSSTESYTKTGTTADTGSNSYGKNIIAEGYSQSGSRVDGTGTSSESYAKAGTIATTKSSDVNGDGSAATGFSQSGLNLRGFGSFSRTKADASANADVFSGPGIGHTGLGFKEGELGQRKGSSEANVKSDAVTITGNNGFLDRYGDFLGSYTGTGATVNAGRDSSGKSIVAEGNGQSGSRVDGTGSSTESYTKAGATAVAGSNNYGKNIIAEGHSQSGSRVDGTGTSSESYTKVDATPVAGSNSHGKNIIAQGYSQSGSRVDGTGTSSESYTKTSATTIAGSNSYEKNTDAERNAHLRSWLDRFEDFFGPNTKDHLIANLGSDRFGGNGASAIDFDHPGSSFRGFGPFSGAKAGASASADVFSGPGTGYDQLGLDFGGQRRGMTEANAKSNALAITGNNRINGNGVAGGYSQSGSWLDGFGGSFGSNAKTTANVGAGFGQSGFSGAKADASASARGLSGPNVGDFSEASANAYASNTGNFRPGVTLNGDIGASNDLTRMKRHLHTYKTKSDSSSIIVETPRAKLAIAKSRVKTRPSHLHQHPHHF